MDMPSLAVLIFCFFCVCFFLSCKLMKDIKQGYEISVHMDGCEDMKRHNVWGDEWKMEVFLGAVDVTCDNLTLLKLYSHDNFLGYAK